MVRTLDFHSNNAGSNPAGSKVTNNILQLKTGSTNTTSLRCEFFFVSLLPLLSTRRKFCYERLKNSLGNKIYLKKSYLILLWLNYLASNRDDTRSIKVTKIQSKTKLYTVVKAPMAHKTNSKEQFISKYYHFKVQFIVRRSAASYSPHKTTGILNISLLDCFPAFETNLLFLTATKIHIPLSLTNYLTR